MKKITLCIILLLIQISANGQSISGKITNESKNPLPYVNIGIIGLNRGTISSGNGLFQIDISGVDNEEIIRFSYVGFESVDFKIGDLRTNHTKTLNITMKEKSFQLQEVVVKPNNEKPIYIGSKKAGRMAWIWSEAINGAEIGTLFKNTDLILLEKFYFHIRKNYCDSILYRIKVYDGKNEFPQEIINSKDIRFISKIKKGWDSIDLTEYNIKVDSDFIITLETLESWTNSEYRTTHLSVGKPKGSFSYSRASSMAPWTEFGNPMSFRVEINECVKNESTNR